MLITSMYPADTLIWIYTVVETFELHIVYVMLRL